MEFSPRRINNDTVNNTYCSVPGCKSKGDRDLTVRFHFFPRPNKKQTVKIENKFGALEEVGIFTAWQMKTKIEKKISKYMRICSLHFKADDYKGASKAGIKRRYLKKTAVPSCNLPEKLILTEPEGKTKKETVARFAKNTFLDNPQPCCNTAQLYADDNVDDIDIEKPLFSFEESFCMSRSSEQVSEASCDLLEGNPDLLSLTKEQLRYRYICELHFTENSFYSATKKRLLPKAVPIPYSTVVNAPSISAGNPTLLTLTEEQPQNAQICELDFTENSFYSATENKPKAVPIPSSLVVNSPSTSAGSNSPEYIPKMSTSSCMRTYGRVGKIDLSPHDSDSDTNEEEFMNIENDCSDSQIVIKEEILPEIDASGEELPTNLHTNNSINEYKFEAVDINSDSENKHNRVKIKEENFDNLLTSFTDNADAPDISINKTEYESGDSFSEPSCRYNFEPLPESNPRCSIGTQTEGEKKSGTAESYFNLFVEEYFKEAPDSTSDVVRKMLEIDGCILKLIKCRQNMSDNFNEPNKCTNSLVMPERLPDTIMLHSAIDLDAEESTTKRKPDCSYQENSEVVAYVEGTKTEGSKTIKIVTGQIEPERLPDTDPLYCAIDSSVEKSSDESIIFNRKLDCGYSENSEIAVCDDGTKAGGRSWRKTAKKRKFDNSELQGNSQIATYDESTGNAEISNDDLHVEDEYKPGESYMFCSNRKQYIRIS